MHLTLILGLMIAALIVIWIIIRLMSSSKDSTKHPSTSVLSSDGYTKFILTVIAISTSIIALQGFLN